MSIYFERATESTLSHHVERIFSELHFKPHGTVLVKPNFSGRHPIAAGENTSPDMLRAIVLELKKYSCKVIIAHYPLLSLSDEQYTLNEIIESGGYGSLKDLGVEFLDLSVGEHKTVLIRNLPIKIPKIVDEVDFVVNLPKAKTHMITDVSLANKNLMGLIDGNSRKIFHKFFLNEMIGFLGVHIKPSINIIDGIISMEGNGPHEGDDLRTDFIAGGYDMVELDSLVSHLMGFDYKRIVHITQAHNLGVGNYASQDSIEKYQGRIREFKKPHRYMKVGSKLTFWPTTSCSLCHEIMRGFKKKVYRNPILGLKFLYYSYFSSKKINIIIGRCEYLSYFSNDINVCIGVCTKWYAEENNIEFLSGCPPSTEQVIEYVFKNLRESKMKS